MMIAPNIQKEIVNACAKEIMKAIVEDLNGDYFGILVDESKDVSHKEQMALVLRYVNKEGKLIERFLSIVHVKKTTASSLQKAIYDFLLEHPLSPSQIWGQGYDGASNMQGEINGLKTLILKDNPSAYCIHCFAHQLQLTLVAVAKQYCDVDQFFDIVANVLNIVGSSFKRRDMLREDQAKKLEELQVLGEVHTGSGLNQELGLQRSGRVGMFGWGPDASGAIGIEFRLVLVLECWLKLQGSGASAPAVGMAADAFSLGTWAHPGLNSKIRMPICLVQLVEFDINPFQLRLLGLYSKRQLLLRKAGSGLVH
uniref:Zinc finger MYM-type protein 1-like n=1 Tax=Nicotiana sylvestris TaxID=4096 RepID=A0A1U7Y232_NICSY|nr:PREDICTED: zinc finger MYM-type protein 1-like [Nicotiana sylvestris]